MSVLGNILCSMKRPKEPRNGLILPQKYGFFSNFTHYVDVFNYLSWFLVKALVTLIRILSILICTYTWTSIVEGDGGLISPSGKLFL